MSEPIIIRAAFCAGVDIDVQDGFTRLIGWDELPAGGQGQLERRVEVRMVLPNGVFRRLISEGRRKLARSSH